MLGIDPITIVALGLGLMTAVAFMLVAAVAPTPGSRRYRRRLHSLSGQERISRTSREDDSAAPKLTRRPSTTPTLDRIIQRLLPRRDNLLHRLQRTGRDISITHYFLATLVVVLVATLAPMLIFGLRGIASLLIGIAVGIGLPLWVVGRLGKRRVAAFIGLFPEAIDLMVRALRSGLPISEAIINAGQEVGDPVGVEFRGLEAGMRLGRELEALLWEISKRIDAPEFRFFIIAIGVQRETGGNLAETLNNLSDLLRRRRAMRAKARAMAAEARASMLILGCLPIIVIIVLMMTSPGYIMTLFTDPRGLALCGLALTMLTTGILSMNKLAKFEI